MNLIQNIIQQAVTFVIPAFWSLCGLVLIAALIRSPQAKQFLELVANIPVQPDDFRQSKSNTTPAQKVRPF
jgi:uncharacterized membrane protein YoaK (UPF0700 family)